MRRYLSLLGCVLLTPALLTGRPISAAEAAAEDAKAAQESKEDEKPKADEEAKSAEKAKEAEAAKTAPGPKPETHTVNKEPLKIEAELSGDFEAQKMTEISLELEAWTALKVVSAVEHGTQVKQGDLLVSLEREKIDRAIADLRKDHEESDLALKLAEQQMATLEKTTPMDLAAGERTSQEVQDDLKYYFEVSRPMALKSAESSLKYAQESYEFQEEELRQLEKMYAADDLTEETEEIILKRARNSLQRAKFYLEQSQIYHDRTVNVLTPRDDVAIREAAQRLDLRWKDTKFALPLTLKRQILSLEKLRLLRSRSEEKLKELLADRDAMTVKAPTSGVVYYGKCVRGKFSGSGSTSLREGSSLMPKQVFMTIVKPRPMFIRTSITESQLHQVRAGVKGTAVPTGYPDMELAAIVERVDAVPTASGSFDARITVAVDDEAEPLMPGMTCKVKLVCYENREALTIPPKYLKTDEDNKKKHYVYLLREKGEPEKRYVTVGKRTATKVEILKGLSEGDQVLPEAPKEEKPTEEEKKTPEKEKEPSEKQKDSPAKDEDAAKRPSNNYSPLPRAGEGQGVRAVAGENTKLLLDDR